MTFIILCFFMALSMSLGAQRSGCTDMLAINFDPDAEVNDGSCLYKDTLIRPVLSQEISPRLEETSGLIWWRDLLWTHNDDTDTQVYGLDLSGKITDSILIRGPGNTDWEEIGQDEDFIYIADVGNNATGMRDDLHILRFSKSKTGNEAVIPDTIWFSYQDQNSQSPSGPNNTDFDCEAFIIMGDSILLFTKEWITMNTTCYILPKTPGTHIARPVDTIEVKGLVTGASYLPENRIIVFTGYTRTGQPFLYLLYDFFNKEFSKGNKRKVNIDDVFLQIEAICHVGKLDFYVTNERLVRAPIINKTQALHYYDLSDLLGPYLNGVAQLPGLTEEKQVEAFPNPFDTGITVKVPQLLLGETALILNLEGKVMWKELLSTQRVQIPTTDWPAGNYFLITRHQTIPLIKSGY